MSEKIIDKIRKLLALGGGNANEHESARALELASDLMMKHGIEQSAIDDEPLSAIIDTTEFAYRYPWDKYLALSAGHLVGAYVVQYPEKTAIYVGRSDNCQAGLQVLSGLHAQMQQEYKTALKRHARMTVAERGKFRHNFKQNFAFSVWDRINQIVDSQMKKSMSTDKSLVVHHRATLEQEIYEAMHKRFPDIKSRSVVAQANLGDGSVEGRVAGQRAKIQDVVVS